MRTAIIVVKVGWDTSDDEKIRGQLHRLINESPVNAIVESIFIGDSTSVGGT